MMASKAYVSYHHTLFGLGRYISHVFLLAESRTIISLHTQHTNVQKTVHTLTHTHTYVHIEKTFLFNGPEKPSKIMFQNYH